MSNTSLRGYSSQPSGGPLSKFREERSNEPKPSVEFGHKKVEVEPDGRGILVLTRKNGEKIEIPGLNMTITIELETGYKARVIIQAPREIAIVRGELLSRLAR